MATMPASVSPSPRDRRALYLVDTLLEVVLGGGIGDRNSDFIGEFGGGLGEGAREQVAHPLAGDNSLVRQADQGDLGVDFQDVAGAGVDLHQTPLGPDHEQTGIQAVDGVDQLLLFLDHFAVKLGLRDHCRALHRHALQQHNVIVPKLPAAFFVEDMQDAHRGAVEDTVVFVALLDNQRDGYGVADPLPAQAIGLGARVVGGIIQDNWRVGAEHFGGKAAFGDAISQGFHLGGREPLRGFGGIQCPFVRVMQQEHALFRLQNLGNAIHESFECLIKLGQGR